MKTPERVINVFNGWPMLFFLLAVPFVVGGTWFVTPGTVVLLILTTVLIGITWVLCLCGFYTLEPNEAGVLVLFGKYIGTDKTSGFRWANPFYKKIKVSLRARNLNMETIKVNDQRGNPVEIAAVVVWQVNDTAEAVFDVDDFEHYVSVQSESALRHLAMAYPYDDHGDEGFSLRGSPDEVSRALQKEIQERAGKAGVEIVEARLSHLAYAQEIAGAMLQRQQAEAIVAARKRIVEGAVGMVEDALAELEKTKTVDLDEERKAAMVSNLLVVLCGHQDAQPVINAGTLYS